VIREWSWSELMSKLPQDGRYLTGILVRRVGTPYFGWLPHGEPVHPGDLVLLYAIDKTDVAQIGALNKEFDRHYYPPQTGIQPDEVELVRTRFPEGGARVLEVCCGAGRITGHLVREGNRVVGLDFNRHCLAPAGKRDGTRVDYVLGDATNLPFADASFDITCCLENGFGVLFALALPALVEMIRVTRPGGRVLLGLREQAGTPDNFHSYHTANGLMSIARTFDDAAVRAMLAELPEAAAARIASRHDLAGAPRPWGGVTFYVELLLTEGHCDMSHIAR
jgi:SAM-dependent methyltransferase